MTGPYDIDEIFPDDSVGAVRLPRRQAGNSPQGLAVTLLADYTLRTRAWLPSAAIVALLAESGVSQAGARTAISRLARRGALEGRQRGRRSFYRLTGAAAGFLSIGGSAIVAPTGSEPWDEHWTVIAFSLPREEAARRRALRAQLRWMGFAPLYDGQWVSPHDLSDKARGQLTQFGATMTVFRARHVDSPSPDHRSPVETRNVDPPAPIHRSPMDAWDIAALTREYESFVESWSSAPPRIQAGRIAGAEAVRTRTEVMDTYRRLPVLDPRLPVRLLPAGWLREPARDLFITVYDGLAPEAEDHVRAVAARFTDDPVPGIRAHTVAELAAGLPVSDFPADNA